MNKRTSAKVVQTPSNLVVWDSGRYVQLNWDKNFEDTTQTYNIYISLPQHF
jgi:hypothetical protein